MNLYIVFSVHAFSDFGHMIPQSHETKLFIKYIDSVLFFHPSGRNKLEIKNVIFMYEHGISRNYS